VFSAISSRRAKRDKQGSIAKPVNEVIGAAFLGMRVMGDHQAEKRVNNISIESGEGLGRRDWEFTSAPIEVQLLD